MILFENTCAPVHAASTQLKTHSLSNSISLLMAPICQRPCEFRPLQTDGESCGGGCGGDLPPPNWASELAPRALVPEEPPPNTPNSAP